VAVKDSVRVSVAVGPATLWVMVFVLVTCVDTVTGTVEVLVATPPTKEVQKLEAALPSSLSWTPASWTAGLPAGIAWEELASSRRAAVALNMVAVVGTDTEGAWRLKESENGSGKLEGAE